jgi:hypothetical protein
MMSERGMGRGAALAPDVRVIEKKQETSREIKVAAYCRVSTDLEIQQQSLDEKIRFVPNLWSTKGTKEQFLIVEDEFCNIFSTMRAFLSRGTDQLFVNVLSENYLLRDYMRCNEQIFMTNPGAVPSLVPDYVRTERNVLLKLVLKMSSHPVKEDEIREDLSLSGCSSEDVYREILTLLERYTFADKGIVDTRLVNESGESLMANNVCYYSIPRGSYYNNFGKTLKSAFFLVEDEERDASYIDARMFGHVTQLLLPGQFLTYEGKYYRVRSVTPENGVILRRASDLYSGRKYYRQLRTYTIHKADTENLLSTRQIGDMRLDMFPCSFSVHTEGFNQILCCRKIISLTNMAVSSECIGLREFFIELHCIIKFFNSCIIRLLSE